MRTIEIAYDNGERVKLRTVPWSQHEELCELLEILAFEFLRCDSLPGELLRFKNATVWGTMRKIAAMVPVVGGGNLEIDRIDDCDLLLSLFFTASESRGEYGEVLPDKKTSDEKGIFFSPSQICSLHGFNFFAIRAAAIDRLIQERMEREKQEKEAMLQSIPEPEPSPSSGKSTKTAALSAGRSKPLTDRKLKAS